MVKKKKADQEDFLTGYIPSNFSPTITPNQIKQIPPYEDSYVKYQGYSKQLISGDVYKIQPQIPRIQIATLSGATATSATGTRLDPNKKFVANFIHLIGITTAQATINIRDGTSTGTLKLILQINPGNNVYTIDFRDSPRIFSSPTIYASVSAMGGANDYVEIQLIGWAED